MKKLLVCLFLSLLFLLASCVDNSRPWKDDQGHWHTHQVCHIDYYTTYTSIPAGEDSHGHMHYITIPHQNKENVCIYE